MVGKDDADVVKLPDEKKAKSVSSVVLSESRKKERLTMLTGDQSI